MTLPLVLLNRRRIGGFNPRAILAGSTALVWLDPSDLTTLFQDAAGTTPVTAPGQPVGRILDKSGNGFHATASGTSRPTYGVVPSRGRVNLLTRTEEFNDAVWTKVAATVTSIGAGVWGISGGSVLQGYGGTGAATVAIDVKADAATTVDIQLGSTVASRTRLTFSTGALSATGADITSATATVLADGWFRVVISGTASGNRQVQISPTTGSVFARFPQAELGSTASPYQRVGSAFDVTDPVGFPSYPCHYLGFDGIDDFMQTPTITPGADKVQVFAGVRKLSDAAIGTLVELSATSASNSGSFTLLTPDSPQPYSFGSRGTTRVFASALGSYPAPITNVLTGLGDISGDLAALRVNGTQAAQSTADQGTGNYLAYPLYIGRRGGTSLPFNGQLFGLIVRFSTANLDAGLISQTERWVAGKTPIDAASEVTWNDSTDTYTQRLYNGFGV